MNYLLEKYPLNANNNYHYNQDTKFLVDETLRKNLGTLSSHEALLVNTGSSTGRSAKDKYLVKDEVTSVTVDWTHDLNEFTREKFEEVKAIALNYFNEYKEEIYVSTRSVGADDTHHLEANLITTGPSHNLFFNNMFRSIEEHNIKVNYETSFTIFHLPFITLSEAEKSSLNTLNNKGVFIDLAQKEIIIIGTAYAGEIKKSIFSIMNYLLPEKNVLPMHSGANEDLKGNVSVFFGLSGTGKTTLSTDEGTKLIGDDEHGLSDEGTFNFENGCYAKTFDLKKENEPDIWHACHSYGTIIENVKYDEETKVINFADKSITENGRASYPLSSIKNIKEDSRGKIPKNIFFLSADAFGVLPPVAKLNNAQAMYYFLSGYTAKLAGTEIGVTEPVAAFSTCFGGPFMMRHPKDYANLLGQLIEKHNINVWLINTGWTAGAYGTGHRFPIKVTRSIIRNIQADNFSASDFKIEPYFGLSIPTKLGDLKEEMLNPSLSWADKTAYKKSSASLAKMFQENFAKYKLEGTEIIKGAPHAVEINSFNSANL